MRPERSRRYGHVTVRGQVTRIPSIRIPAGSALPWGRR